MDDVVPKGISTSENKADFLVDEGLQVIDLTQAQLEEVSTFYNDMYLSQKVLNPRKEISNDTKRHVGGSIFALGSSKYNPEWKEHCASSLREMMHPWKDKSMLNAYKNIYTDYNGLDQKIKDESSQLCNGLNIYYRYFSGIVHHNPTGIVSAYRDLGATPVEDYEECITDRRFVNIVQRFFTDSLKLSDFIQSE